MFENVGSKLFNIVRIFVFLELLLSGLVGIAIVINLAANSYSGIGTFFIGLLVVIIILFFEYIMGMFMIAFCEMMADIHSIKEKIVYSQFNYNNGSVSFDSSIKYNDKVF